MTVKTVGLDLAKNVYQVRCVSATGRKTINKKIKRAKLISVFETLLRCGSGMEASGSSYNWGRELSKLVHDDLLKPAAYVKFYVKRGKTDAADAEAICEAVRRPTMRLVEIKSEDQQAVLAIHRARDLIVRQRTQVVNMIRSILRELTRLSSSEPAFAPMVNEGSTDRAVGTEGTTCEIVCGAVVVRRGGETPAALIAEIVPALAE